jgi:hypothetical protein
MRTVDGGHICAANPPVPMAFHGRPDLSGAPTLSVSGMRPPVNEDTPACRFYDSDIAESEILN